MEQVIVPQIDGSMPNKNPDAAALALTGNTRQDLANVAKELGVTLDASGNVTDTPVAQPAPVTRAPQPVPAQPQAAPVAEVPAVEVPPKFQNPDGTPNEAKLEKSTRSLEEGIAYYKAKEREFQQTQNRVNNPPPAPVQPVQPQNAQLSNLEYQMAQDLINESAAQGVQLDQRLAIAQARVMARGLEAKHAAERNMNEDLHREIQENRMTSELSRLIEADGSIASPEVADRVLAIKQEMGFKTYREAYIQHLGEQEIQKRTGQVKTPIPTGQTVKAPPTPVGPVTRVQRTVDITNPKSLTTEQLEAEVRKFYPGLRYGPRL